MKKRFGMGIWNLLRRMRPAGRSPIMCHGSARLTTSHSLHLVHCQGKAWLVSCHPHGTTLLGTWEGRHELGHEVRHE